MSFNTLYAEIQNKFHEKVVCMSVKYVILSDILEQSILLEEHVNGLKHRSVGPDLDSSLFAIFQKFSNIRIQNEKGTVLRIIKLNLFPVPVRLHSGSGILIFRRYFTTLFDI